MLIKQLRHGALCLMAAACLAVVACAGGFPTGATPAQNLVNTTGNSCRSLGDAIRATDAAVLNRVISKPAALEAVKGFTAAQLACSSALGAIQAANPPAAAASGATP